ncbi:hypothetical protein DL771_001590 [Monosporascus sp. 5C6A]|nr:hypothetical protein DL771_001590 [Monosporascus sp. 5C6A]
MKTVDDNEQYMRKARTTTNPPHTGNGSALRHSGICYPEDKRGLQRPHDNLEDTGSDSFSLEDLGPPQHRGLLHIGQPPHQATPGQRLQAFQDQPPKKQIKSIQEYRMQFQATPGQQVGDGSIARAQIAHRTLLTNGIDPTNLTPAQFQSFQDLPPQAQAKSVQTYAENLKQLHDSQLPSKPMGSAAGPQAQDPPILKPFPRDLFAGELEITQEVSDISIIPIREAKRAQTLAKPKYILRPLRLWAHPGLYLGLDLAPILGC